MELIIDMGKIYRNTGKKNIPEPESREFRIEGDKIIIKCRRGDEIPMELVDEVNPIPELSWLKITKNNTVNLQKIK